MNPSPWTPDDLNQMKDFGIDPAEATHQLELFRNPPPALTLDRPAFVADGIRKMDDAQKTEALQKYEQARIEGRFMKFVPASGAASRMFQLLLKYSQRSSLTKDELQREAAAGNKEGRQVLDFMDALERVAFYDDLETALSRCGKEIKTLRKQGQYLEILRALLFENGLNYSQKPKGLIRFHSYRAEKRTPFEEHLLEAVRYVRDGANTCRIHFTVSDEHLAEYRDFLRSVKDGFEQKHGIRLVVDFSIQEPRTNTLAVGLDNEPFRDERGRLVFRPSGHGALLGNLNDLPGDLIYVKNIDNVTVESRLETTASWKRILGGYLVCVQERIFDYLHQLVSKNLAPSDLREIQDFALRDLGITPGEDFNALAHDRKIEALMRLLDRPVRVCGVVPNTDEPGGGPFWVKGPDGRTHLQIVESAQIDLGRLDQKEIMKKSTHFNPVDLVCGVRDRAGKPYDLGRYSDSSAVFISRKAFGGRELKALELPGLWNGAMSGWITLFVEVPLETFNPVKTVFDLLRPTHQA
jgi:hypothetical protein